jgi:hypothetical protein
MVCKKLWLPENIWRSHISIKRGHAHVGTACTLAFNPLSEQTLPGNGILTLFVYILASPTMGAALGRGGENHILLKVFVEAQSRIGITFGISALSKKACSVTRE